MDTTTTKLSAAILRAANEIVLESAMPQDAIDFIAQIDQSGLVISNYKIETKAEGKLISMDLPSLPDGEIVLNIPQIPFISLVLEPAIFNQNPSINFLVPTGTTSYLDVNSLMLALRFNTDLLHPADGTPHAELQFAANLRFFSDWKIILKDAPALSLTACEIADTGIFITIKNLKFQLSGKLLVPEIAALNLPESFRGLYSKEATLKILKNHFYVKESNTELRTPGINIKFENVAIGNSGVTFSATQTFELSHPDNNLRGNLVGYLLNDSIELGISKVNLKLFKTEFSEFSVDGMIRLNSNFINTLFDASIGIKRLQGNKFQETLAIKTEIHTTISFASLVEINFDKLNLNGSLEPDSFELNGTLDGLSIHFEHIANDALTFSATEVLTSIKHSKNINSIHIKMDTIRLGAFGAMSGELSAIHTTKENGEENWDVKIDGKIRWSDIKDKLKIPDVWKAADFLPNTCECDVSLEWLKEGTDKNAKLNINLELPETVKLEDFIEQLPDGIKLDVRKIKMHFETDFASVPSVADGAIGIEGKYSFVFDVKLPELPEFLNMVKIKTGSNDGWVTAELNIGASISEGNGSIKVDANILNPFSADFLLPGVEQTEAPIRIQIEKIKTSVEVGSDNVSAGFEMDGKFTLKAIDLPVDFLYKQQLEKLLNPVFLNRTLEGNAKLKIALVKEKDDDSPKWDLGIIAELNNTRIELDIIDFFEDILRGAASTVSDENIPHLPIDLEIGCIFKGFHFRVHDLTGHNMNEEKFRCELTADLSFAGSGPVECNILFTNKCFGIGIKGDIPLRIPSVPFDIEDLRTVDYNDYLLTDNDWETKLNYLNGDNGQIKHLEENIQALKNTIGELNNLNNNTDESILRFNGLKTELENKIVELNKKTIKASVLKAIRTTINKMASSEGDEHDEHIHSRHMFMNWMKIIARGAGYFNDVTSKGFPYFSIESNQIKINNNLKLHIDAKFTFDYTNRNNIGLKGGAWLKGLSADDFLKPLFNNDDDPKIKLDLGLGADTIYFSLSTAADGIQIPYFNYTPGGKLTIAKFFIGFGYTKRSLAVVLDGAVELPEKFVDDLNTTQELGIGIKLPDKVQLYFRFDLIPVPVIKVLPYFEFKFDLRRDVSPGIRDTKNCIPNWDGLEFHIPGIYEADFKYLVPNFMHGPFAAPSLSYAFDEKVGNNINGYTIIVDNLKLDTGVWMYPWWWEQIPFFCSLFTPSFDNICFNLRMAGFGINFDLQRPFPSFSLIALLELMGLISDPQSKINPDGDLANSVRITIRDTYLIIPELLRKIFPQLSDINRVEVNKTLNMATLLPFFQKLFEISKQGLELAKSITTSTEINSTTIIKNIKDHLSDHPQLELIKYLPIQMRKFSVGANLGGFEAEVTLVFADFNEAKRQFSIRTNFTPDYNTIDLPPEISLPDYIINATTDSIPTDEQKQAIDLKQKEYSNLLKSNLIEYGRKIIPSRFTIGTNNFYDPNDSENNLFKEDAFSKFEISDFDLFIPDDDKVGVIALANVNVFDALKIYFMGSIFEDGLFNFVSTTQVNPFNINIPWTNQHIPINILSTSIIVENYDPNSDSNILGEKHVNKLFLKGSVNPNNAYAQIEANFGFTWDYIHDLLKFENINAAIKINSNGRFSINGSGQINLYNGKGYIEASNIFISESYCSCEGEFSYNIPDIISLVIDVKGSVGPNDQFKFSGEGILTMFNDSKESFNVLVCITETSAEISFGMHGNVKPWCYVPDFIYQELHIDADLKGYIDFNKDEFFLQGATIVKLPAHENLRELELVKGSCIFEYKYSHFKFIAFGDIDWFGTHLTTGKLEISNRYFNVEGNLNLALPGDLTKISDDLKIPIANLFFYPYLNLNAKGGFYFNDASRKSYFKFNGNYDLGIRNETNVVFSVLKGKLPDGVFHFDRPNVFRIPIVDFGGGSLFPINKMSIGLPQITPGTANAFCVATSGTCFKIYTHDFPNTGENKFLEVHTHGFGDHKENWVYHELNIYSPPTLSFSSTESLELRLPDIAIPVLKIGIEWNLNSKIVKMYKG